ncbi:hypothetical protein Areg01_35360 [Actinoplanes regularis]|nr:hypothetical protein Are01nite_60190 [Actinoplanes regularis]GLW30596.1 hypothetical protein Areg01_35360 [Actinoplanes regularis]
MNWPAGSEVGAAAASAGLPATCAAETQSVNATAARNTFRRMDMFGPRDLDRHRAATIRPFKIVVVARFRPGATVLSPQDGLRAAGL